MNRWTKYQKVTSLSNSDKKYRSDLISKGNQKEAGDIEVFYLTSCWKYKLWWPLKAYQARWIATANANIDSAFRTFERMVNNPFATNVGLFTATV